ncbi:MAG: adenylate kinase [Erysipelotrichaceae bacterium]|nr:adenylate kinase [Erysipelotrichaceae bacterium]
MNLLIIGAPGSGKGTISNNLIKDYDITHVSTGDMLRQAIAQNSPVGLRAAEYMNQGQLVPDSIIHDIIVERLSMDDIKKGFLFDGYPRTVDQAIDLSSILEQLHMKIDAVLELEIDDEILKKRITGRRLCPTCGEIYNIYSKPTKVEDICDKCGGKLITRKDDSLENLTVRLDEYHRNTQPVIEYYEKMDLVKKIDADKSADAVYDDIKSVLEGLK